MIIRLRDGDESAPLFLFPGAGADARELSALASSMRSSRPMLGVELLTSGTRDTFPLTVASIAEACFREISAVQQHGPYYLAGYSFGGLVAIEVARLLKNSEQEVRLLALIDTIYDHRHWPKSQFLISQARRICWHVRRIRTLPLREATSEFKHRLRRLRLRLRDRRERCTPSEPALTTASADSAQERCSAAMKSYIPAHYPGKIIVFRAVDEDFACDPAHLWHKFADTIESQTIPGSHLDIVRNGKFVSRLATELDARLDSVEASMDPANPKAKQPKVLIITAFRWFPMLRLALELSEAGFAVETLVPGGYPIEKMPFVKTTYRYNALAPIASLRAAIMASQPKLLVPYDDCVTTQLHQLYKLTDPSEPAGFRLRSLIARSLGQPEDLSMLYSRYRICSLARELKIPGPATEAVVDKSTLITQLNSLPLPLVLKSDGSWGGRGVVIARNRKVAVRAFRKLSTPPGVLRALKRLIIDRDPTLILPCVRRRRPAVSIQRFVPGRPANAAVACWEGKVLAAVLVEVLCSNGATGSATVVRVTSHPGMSVAIERLVDSLKLSGLCGFDFVLSSEDGSAQLIELNPRATPTCHLTATRCTPRFRNPALQIYREFLASSRLPCSLKR